MNAAVRRLPVVAAPASSETTTSYLQRLAAINCVRLERLTAVLLPQDGRRTRRPDPQQLSRLTGWEPAILQRALPDLGGRTPDPHVYHPGTVFDCYRCTARRPGGRVVRLVKHHEPFCTRHRLWYLHPREPRPHFDISDLPEVIRAQHRHRRTVIRHGHDRTHDAFTAAQSFIDQFAREVVISRHLDPVLDHLRPGWTRISWDEPIWRIASYSTAVTITAFLLDPRWSQPRHAHDSTGLFWTELARRFLDWPPHWPPYTPESANPLAHWAARALGTPRRRRTAPETTTSSSTYHNDLLNPLTLADLDNL